MTDPVFIYGSIVLIWCGAIGAALALKKDELMNDWKKVERAGCEGASVGLIALASLAGLVAGFCLGTICNRYLVSINPTMDSESAWVVPRALLVGLLTIIFVMVSFNWQVKRACQVVLEKYQT